MDSMLGLNMHAQAEGSAKVSKLYGQQGIENACCLITRVEVTTK